jgi:hypothetical protein
MWLLRKIASGAANRVGALKRLNLVLPKSGDFGRNPADLGIC